MYLHCPQHFQLSTVPIVFVCWSVSCRYVKFWLWSYVRPEELHYTTSIFSTSLFLLQSSVIILDTMEVGGGAQLEDVEGPSINRKGS